MSERRCEWCVWLRAKWHSDGSDICKLGRPLKPCPDYQREPGADDDLETEEVRYA